MQSDVTPTGVKHVSINVFWEVCLTNVTIEMWKIPSGSEESVTELGIWDCALAGSPGAVSMWHQWPTQQGLSVPPLQIAIEVQASCFYIISTSSSGNTFETVLLLIIMFQLLLSTVSGLCHFWNTFKPTAEYCFWPNHDALLDSWFSIAWNIK